MDDPGQARDPLDEVAAAAERLTQLEQARRDAANELAAAMYDAHRRGYTWSEIASSAGMASPHTARARARQALDADQLSPSARWRREHGGAPRPKPALPGVSITEAARRLDVTRKTIYSWIDSGKLRVTTDQAGRRRVLLDD